MTHAPLDSFNFVGGIAIEINAVNYFSLQPPLCRGTSSSKVTELFYRGQMNSIIDAYWHFNLPSPFRACLKKNPILLDNEYLNRTNRSVIRDITRKAFQIPHVGYWACQFDIAHLISSYPRINKFDLLAICQEFQI
ncbi:hypothetical protein RJ641_023583 [Dillenia turbinata]|uniref:Uncharacterized protein n=1 Tax=Dillenia turbinata TaxID=194707 RepID=A0AAN8YSY3_9MAGN